MGIHNNRPSKFDADGYIPTGSEERIAQTGDKDEQWGYTKKTDSAESCSVEMDMNSSYLKTSVCANVTDKTDVERGVDHSVSDPAIDEWQGNSADPKKQGQIIKTVHINQYASES